MSRAAADRAELCAASYRALAKYLDLPYFVRRGPIGHAEGARMRTEAAGAAERLRDALPVGEHCTTAQAQMVAIRVGPVASDRLRAWATAWDAYALEADPLGGDRPTATSCACGMLEGHGGPTTRQCMRDPDGHMGAARE